MSARDDTPDQRHQEYQELIDAYVVELDPVVDGFSGVLVELYEVHVLERLEHLGPGIGRRYEVRQSALASGNRLAVFSSREEELARAAFDGKIAEAGLNIPASCGARSIL
jgi:hypothetical protein